MAPPRLMLARLFSRLGMTCMDWSDRLYSSFHPEHLMICRAYGGTNDHGGVRLCSKRRWHSDSHTYDWTDA